MNPIFFDTEFMDNGNTIELISIGMVNLNGDTYYAESKEADLSKAHPWVKQHVLPNLYGVRTSRAQIAREIVNFVGLNPTFWAWYSSHDWVVLTQLYGRMIDTPPTWPQFCFDFKAWTALQNINIVQTDSIHNALDDALWLRQQMLPLFEEKK